MNNGDRGLKAWIAGALFTALLLLPPYGVVAQEGADTRTTIKRPIMTGNFIDAASGQGAFSGNLELGRFETPQNFLVLVGTLKGVLAESRGHVIGRVNGQVVVPVMVIDSTCQLLHLD